MLPAILGVIGSLAGTYTAVQSARAARDANVMSAFAPNPIDALTEGPEPFEGAPDNPGDVGGATRLRWDYKLEQWVPFKARRRKRALSASDRADLAFLKSQGVPAKEAAGLIMAGVGRGKS